MVKKLKNRMISQQRDGYSVWSPQEGGEKNKENRLKVLRARRLTQGETGGLERRLTALTGVTDILWEDKTETARNLHTRNIWTQTLRKQINTVALNWDIRSITHSAQEVQHKITQTHWNWLPRKTNESETTERVVKKVYLHLVGAVMLFHSGL